MIAPIPMGFYKGTTQAMRIMFFAFCGAGFATAIRAIGTYWPSDILNYFSVSVMVVSLAVGVLGMFFGDHTRQSD